jgi:opacity protein-like surface antigen
VIRLLQRAAVLLGLALGLAVAGPARAAPYLDDWHPYQTYWAVGWSAAVPLPSLRLNYIDNTGWLGGGFAFRMGVAGRLALGVSGTWNYFDQTFQSLTIEQPDFTFTGPAFRRLSSFTALGTLHYYLTQSAVQPYVGVGIGGVWLNSTQKIVNVTSGSYTSGLALAGEVGFLFSVAQRLGLYLGGRYQYNLTTIPGVRNPQWVSCEAGVAYYF